MKISSVLLVAGLSLHAGYARAESSRGVLVDRLVIEVNGSSYTQRQVEIYVLLRSALLAQDNGFRATPSESNWSTWLETFKNEMMLEQEAQRLNSFQPNRKMIEAAGRVVAEKRTRSAELDQALRRLGLSDVTERRTLASILRVRGLLVSKEKQRAGGDGGATSPRELEASADWFVKLEQRTPYRVYEGAKTYLPIEPKTGQTSKALP